MTSTFCNSGHVKLKAGKYAEALTNTQYEIFINEAEDLLCNVAKVDLIDAYATLETNGKKILEAVTSSMAAQKVMSYDMSGFSSRGEAVQMLNVLQDEINRGIGLIKEDNIKTYLGAT